MGKKTELLSTNNLAFSLLSDIGFLSIFPAFCLTQYMTFPPQVASLSNGLTVKDMMDTWTKQMGYPVITLSSNGNTLTYKQERFFTNPPSGDIADSPYE